MHADAQTPPTTVVDRAQFGTLQFIVAALCAVVAMLDGFDTHAMGFL